MSWKELEYEFTPGITLLTAWNHTDNNREGAGKSSIFNALCMGVYGKVPKDVKIDETISWGEKSNEIDITLEDNSLIHRTRHPNDLYIWHDNIQEPIRQRTSTETQKYIDSHVGLSFKAFCSTVYFSQDNPYNFLSLNEADKAAVLAELQDIKDFDKARNSCKEVLDALNPRQIELKAELDSLSRESKSLELRLNQEEKQLNNLESEVKAKTELHKKGLKDLEKRETLILESLEKVKDYQEEELVKLETELGALQQKQHEYLLSKKELDNKNEEMQKLSSEFISITSLHKCPTCQQSVEDSDLVKRYTQKLASLKEEIDTLQLSLKDSSSEIKKLQSKVSDYKSKLKSKQSYTVQLLQLKNTIESTKNRIQSLNKEDKKEAYINAVEHTKKLLNETKLSIEVTSKEFDKASKLINEYTILRSSFKEIKQYLFQKLLILLQLKVNEYLKDLFEIPIFVEFTNRGDDGEVSAIELKINIDGEYRSYGLLSGGQADRVKFATNLALSDIASITSKKHFKFRIFDEPFLYFSEESMSKAIDLLKKLEGTTILVQHNSMIQSIVSNNLHIEYKDGISQRK